MIVVAHYSVSPQWQKLRGAEGSVDIKGTIQTRQIPSGFYRVHDPEYS